ncbi:MAG: MFS transporter [Planctomycetes bacterium]|nr:MFS transporter [Planctomycetota bacterium]
MPAAAPPAVDQLGSERRIIAALTAINFTLMMDFVVMMPLGPQLMRVFGITATGFSVAVSAYTFSAALAAVAGALFIDRFGRRQALLWIYAGFAATTLACALAPDFPSLVLARVAAGACGGLVGALVLAVVGDVVPYERRGAAMGRVMSAFALASILGVPAGIWLAAWLGWHATFHAIAAISLIVLALAWAWLPPLRAHLDAPPGPALAALGGLLAQARVWRALAFTAVLAMGSFLVIPFIATYLAGNVGVGERELGLVYLAGGALSVVTSPWIGRLADRHGKQRVFVAVALLAMLPTVALTNLPAWPLGWVLLVTTGFIVLGSGRFVPATALITGTVPPAQRGAFMSLNGAVQSAASGAAAMVAGVVIRQADAHAPLERYGAVGALSCAAVALAVLLSRRLHGEPAR